MVASEEHINTTKKQKHPEKNSETLIIVGPMPFPWSALKNSLNLPQSRLIFVDGGLIHEEKFKKKSPHLMKNRISIGDEDGSKKPLTIKKITQNSSDLAFCLSKLTGKSRPEKCILVGFLGGRIDHELFNLGEIALYLKKFTKKNAPLIQLDNKIVFVGPGAHQAHIQGLFSLASFEDNHIKITGKCEFQTNKWMKIPPLSSRGLSNIGFGEIKIETKNALAIIKS